MKVVRYSVLLGLMYLLQVGYCYSQELEQLTVQQEDFVPKAKKKQKLKKPGWKQHLIAGLIGAGSDLCEEVMRRKVIPAKATNIVFGASVIIRYVLVEEWLKRNGYKFTLRSHVFATGGAFAAQRTNSWLVKAASGYFGKKKL